MPVAPAAAVDAESSSGGALKGLVAGILLLGTALLIITNHVRRADTTVEQLTRNNLPGQAGAGAVPGVDRSDPARRLPVVGPGNRGRWWTRFQHGSVSTAAARSNGYRGDWEAPCRSPRSTKPCAPYGQPAEAPPRPGPRAHATAALHNPATMERQQGPGTHAQGDARRGPRGRPSCQINDTNNPKTAAHMPAHHTSAKWGSRHEKAEPR